MLTISKNNIYYVSHNITPILSITKNLQPQGFIVIDIRELKFGSNFDKSILEAINKFNFIAYNHRIEDIPLLSKIKNDILDFIYYNKGLIPLLDIIRVLDNFITIIEFNFHI